VFVSPLAESLPIARPRARPAKNTTAATAIRISHTATRRRLRPRRARSRSRARSVERDSADTSGTVIARALRVERERSVLDERGVPDSGA